MVERIGDGGIRLSGGARIITDSPWPRLDQLESRIDTMDTQVGWLTHKCENLEERLETA